MQLPSDIRDVKKVVSLSDSIKELIEFDDNELFTYISTIISELNDAVKPSPFIF